MKLNSIIFHTHRLSEIREFYEGHLGMQIGTYLKQGQEVSDCSEKYVNYNIGGTLLCFEIDDNQCDVGTVVLNVKEFTELKMCLEQAGCKVLGGNAHYFKIQDPEGRTLIIEPLR